MGSMKTITTAKTITAQFDRIGYKKDAYKNALHKKCIQGKVSETQNYVVAKGEMIVSYSFVPLVRY